MLLAEFDTFPPHCALLLGVKMLDALLLEVRSEMGMVAA